MRAILFNIQGIGLGSKENKFGNTKICNYISGGRGRINHLIGIVEPKQSSDFLFECYTVLHSPFIDRDGEPANFGGASLLIHDSVLNFYIEELQAPAEVVAAKFQGSMFGLEVGSIVVVIVAYARPQSPAFVVGLTSYIWNLRDAGFDIFMLGDFNAYVGDSSGWAGCDPLWSSGDIARQLHRDTSCSHLQPNGQGVELLHLLRACELCVLNGISRSDGVSFDNRVTRPPVGQALGGSVIDLCIVSESLVPCIDSLQVLPLFWWHPDPDKPNYRKLASDHCRVSVSWNCILAQVPVMPVPCDRPAILGWRYERTGRLLANVDRRDSVIAALASRLSYL